MRSITRALVTSTLFSSLLFVCGCGSDVGPSGKLVGGACQTDRDCDGKCVSDGDFPGGYCTVACGTDAQCPGGTVCIKTAGGMCAVLCSSVGSCSEFGRGYVCKEEDRIGDAGKTSICRVP